VHGCIEEMPVHRRFVSPIQGPLISSHLDRPGGSGIAVFRSLDSVAGRRRLPWLEYAAGAAQAPAPSAASPPWCARPFSPQRRRTATRRVGSRSIRVGTPRTRGGQPSRSRCCSASRPARPSWQLSYASEY
jgi:hypothetical protein